MPEFYEPLFHPLTTELDPFWALRRGIEIATADEKLESYQEPETGETVLVRQSVSGRFEPSMSVYTTVFQQKTRDGKDLVGLSCHVPDWEIPDHPAEQELRARSEDLWRELGFASETQS